MTWPGEALLIKLWETLAEKGIGGLLKPWQVKREAIAQIEVRRLELVALADAEREAEEIRSGRMKLSESNIALALPSPVSDKHSGRKELESPFDARRVVDISTANLISDSIRREVNVAKAISHAEAELKEDTQTPPDHNMDDDWLYRWRDYAGLVSSEELQSLWGRLLAGELKSPGSFSFRTLDFIRNLSPDEAKRIARLSRFVITSFIARSQENLLKEEGIPFSELMRLQDLGVISGVEALGLNMQLTSMQPAEHFIRVLISHGHALVVTHDDPNKIFNISVFAVTEIGRQVLRLGKFETHLNYLKAVGEELKKLGAKVSMAKLRIISENNFEYFDEQEL